MGVQDTGNLLVQVDFEVFGKVQGKHKRNRLKCVTLKIWRNVLKVVMKTYVAV